MAINMNLEYENSDGTKEYSETTMTRIFSARSANLLPHKPTTTFPLQYSAPSLSSDSFATIPPACMKIVGVGYGGLKGYAYLQSLQEFVEDCKDTQLEELLKQRADRVSKGVYSFDLAVKEVLNNNLVEDSINGKSAYTEIMAPALLDLSASDEELTRNNQQIISYMSKVRAGRISEAFSEQEQELLNRLHSQISLLASRQNNSSILNKLSK